MRLRTYVIRRLILIIPTFLLISVLIFTLIHLAPGDPALAFGGRSGGTNPEIVKQLRKYWGLDKPLPVQYFIWLGNLLQGDFGFSFTSERPVLQMIGERVPRTLELMVIAEVLSMLIAITLGVIAAVKHYSVVDSLASVGALLGYSTPSFWLALMAILVFTLQLGWLPSSGVRTVGVVFSSPLDAFLDHLNHLILPVSILVLAWTAYLFRMVRSSMLEVLEQDYVKTARAKGLKERVVIFKHALRNALLPVVTYAGYSVGFLLGGAVVIENIFAWPGLGQLFVYMAERRDYPTMMGLSVIIAIMVLISNLSADVAYALVDPRVRYD